MSPEEIAQSKKLADFVYIGWWLGRSDGFELVRSGLDSSLGESESKISDVFAAEETFLQIDLQSVTPESS